MMETLSLEFFVALLFIVTLVLIFLLILFVKRVNKIQRTVAVMVESVSTGRQGDGPEPAANSAVEIREMLVPLMEASREAADEFDQLIREKKRLTKELNDALDAKIISINLLLSRAGSIKKELEAQQHKLNQARIIPAQSVTPPLPQAPDVLDQQNQIIELYYQDVDIDTIAEQLSIPKGEVQLVVDLKEKFVAMEKTP